MRRKIGIWVLLLGLFACAWGISVPIFGWRASSLPVIFSLAAAVWLAGAALVASGKPSNIRLWLAAGATLLAALLLIPPIFIEHEPSSQIAVLKNTLLGFLLVQLLPALSLVVAAMLLATGLRQPELQGGPPSEQAGAVPSASRKAALAAFSLAGLVLAGGLYHLYWLLVWDSTYDALDFLNLIIPALAALFGAALLAEQLKSRQKLFGLLYALFVPAFLILVYLNAKQVDFRALTEARSERISQALERYRTRRGSYPESLNQLTPWTLVTIPEPVIMHGQNWCYQGEQDAYRLGYVDREHWSSPELFPTVYKAQGAAGSAAKLCAEEIAVLKTLYPDFYGLAGTTPGND